MAKHTNTNSATQETTANHTSTGISTRSAYPNAITDYPPIRAGRGIVKRLKPGYLKGFTVVEQPAPNEAKPVAETPLMPDQDYHDHMPEWATKATA